MAETIFRVSFVGLNVSGTPVTFSYATKGCVINGVAYMERVLEPGFLRHDMFGGNRPYGDCEIPTGSATLNNADAGLATLAQYGFDAQQFLIYTCSSDAPDAETLLHQYTMEEPIFSGDTITIPLRDRCYELDKPLLTAKYGGTNVLPAGIDGTAADIKGRPKPMVVGKVYNITPVCVNTSKLIYQVDGVRGLVTGWTIVWYDKRAALVAGANYVSQADMEATAPAAGQYRVWPAGGCVRLGTTPVGKPTSDVYNPGVAFGAQTADSLAGVIRAVLQKLGADLTAYTIDDPAVGHSLGGAYYDSEISGLDAMKALLRSLCAFMRCPTPASPTATLSISVQQLKTPGSIASTAIVEAQVAPKSMVRVQQSDPLRGIPCFKVLYGYQRNYTVMSESELAGVASADIEFTKRDYRVYEELGGEVFGGTSIRRYPKAKNLEINTQGHSIQMARFYADQFGSKRSMFAFTVPYEAAAALQLNSMVTVQHSVDPSVLNGSATLVVMGFQRNLKDNSVDLTIWG